MAFIFRTDVVPRDKTYIYIYIITYESREKENVRSVLIASIGRIILYTILYEMKIYKLVWPSRKRIYIYIIMLRITMIALVCVVRWRCRWRSDREMRYYNDAPARIYIILLYALHY